MKLNKIKLGDYCDISSGGDKPDTFSEFLTSINFIPVVSNGIENKGIIGYTNKCGINEKSITMAARGSCGYLYYRDYAYYPVIRLLTLIPKNINVLDTRYLYYLLKMYPYKAIGSVQSQITVPQLRNHFVYFNENVNVQKKIASLLGLLDEKIESNNKINSELESMVKTIYDYWFLQFEFPNEDGKPYKSSGGKMVWSKELKREIPEGWEVTNLYNENLFSIIDVGLKKFDKKIYLATANIDDGVFTKGNIVDYDSRESRANMQPKQYSVWFAKMKDSVKHLFIPKNSNWFTDKYILSTGLYGLQCNEISFAYVASYIGNKNFEIQKNLLAHGSTQKAISDDDLKKFKLIVPSIDILKKYAEKINPIFEMIFSNLKENEELSSLRDFLLPLLMNGQVVIED